MRVLVVADGAQDAAAVGRLLDRACPAEFEVLDAGGLQSVATLLLGMQRPSLDCVLILLGEDPADATTTIEHVRTAALGVPVVVHGGPDGDDRLALASVMAGAQDHLLGELDGRALGRALRHAAERGRREQALSYRALHDPLTGLANRTLVVDRLHQAVSRVSRTGTMLALLFVDLDGFKQVNDTRGHAAGDALLVEVALRLRATLRGGDTAARFGGDEFLVLCEDVSGRDEVRAIAERVLETLHVPCSIGIALGRRDDAVVEALLRDADAAMYEVKRRGGAGWHVAGDVSVQPVP